MSVFIPLKDLPNYKETVTLDGTPFDLSFTWNTREQAWHLSIDRDNVRILSGVKIINSWELIGRFANVLLPSGLILVLDLAKLDELPGRDNLGTDFKLAYITEVEAESGIIQ